MRSWARILAGMRTNHPEKITIEMDRNELAKAFLRGEILTVGFCLLFPLMWIWGKTFAESTNSALDHTRMHLFLIWACAFVVSSVVAVLLFWLSLNLYEWFWGKKRSLRRAEF